MPSLPTWFVRPDDPPEGRTRLGLPENVQEQPRTSRLLLARCALFWGKGIAWAQAVIFRGICVAAIERVLGNCYDGVLGHGYGVHRPGHPLPLCELSV